LRYYYINENLAVAGNVPKGKEGVVCRNFRLIIALLEPNELVYDVSLMRELGCEVLVIPTRPGTLPTVLLMYELINRIKYLLSSGSKVLIHCSNGKSRSCALATAYLMTEENTSLIDALTRVKLVRGSVLITEHQLRRLKILEYLLSRLTSKGLDAMYVFGGRFNFGDSLNHASRTIEVSYYLMRELGRELGLSRVEEVTTLLASGLHDIGRKYCIEGHEVRSYELIRDSIELYSVFGSEVREATAWVARYHRVGSGNPLESRELPPTIKWCVVRATSILRIANVLASSPKHEVCNITADISGSDLIMRVEWLELPPNKFVSELNNSLIKASELLLNILGVSDLRVTHEEVYI